MKLYSLFKPLIFCLDPERAHNLAIGFLRFFPNLANVFSLGRDYKNLQKSVFGINFKSPVGLAAGFDKNAEVVKAMSGFGFGFVEVGTVTPKPQSGNEKPRIFRLKEDGAIINRLGFNNKGSEQVAKNIERFKFAKSDDEKGGKIICGVNIGKNKDTKSAEDDYLLLLEKFYKKASYITINISSPNTKNLRDIQQEDNLKKFLTSLANKKLELRKKSGVETPILLKVAPDLSDNEIATIANLVLENGIDGLIVSNTTISRGDDLKSGHSQQSGGLSGRPLFEKSNMVLSKFYSILQGKVPIIAVGGVSSADDVYRKIELGADLVQIYSALIYDGFNLVEAINKDLSERVERLGLANVSDIKKKRF